METSRNSEQPTNLDYIPTGEHTKPWHPINPSSQQPTV